MVKTYDPKSYELAEHFLQDEPNLDCADARHNLALTIQAAIEDWFEDRQREIYESSDERRFDEEATYCPATDSH